MKLVPALKYLCIPLFLTLRDIEMNDIHHNPAKNNLDLLSSFDLYISYINARLNKKRSNPFYPFHFFLVRYF